MDNDAPIAIGDLYPDFTAAELEEAEANLRRYLSVLVRMAERLASEGRSINDLAAPADLTLWPEESTIQNERSNPSHH